MVAAIALRGFKDQYDSVASYDARYWDEEVACILSERAFITYKLHVELALVEAFGESGIAPPDVVDDVRVAIGKIDAKDVYKEEKKTKHDIRALVNCICRRVSRRARPYVHLMATSYDIIDTANAMRYGEIVDVVLLPRLTHLARILHRLARDEAMTVQVGRTHGQHASPITFGFAIAGYLDRIGNAILEIKNRRNQVTGKFTGAVGANNSASLFWEEWDAPNMIERIMLDRCGVKPARITTQIVPPEPLARLLHEMVLASGIMADLANDMRQLQRSEIAEVAQAQSKDQVGSSTMTYKQNPDIFENVVSQDKIVVGRMATVYMDMKCEHQRDLTNSSSSRTYVEIAAYVCEMARRLGKAMETLVVRPENMRRNLEMSAHLLGGEPLYLALASLGHPNAHEVIRVLSRTARDTGTPVGALALKKRGLKPYFTRMTPTQRHLIDNPMGYIGNAKGMVIAVTGHWQETLGL